MIVRRRKIWLFERMLGRPRVAPAAAIQNSVCGVYTLASIPIRPLRVYAMEALAKIKDVEVLRPYKELFDRLRTDRDGLVAYNSGLIADKLDALSESSALRQEEIQEHE